MDPDKDPDFDSVSFREKEWHRGALHYAAAAGETGAMQLLLDAHADPNLQDGQYKMALHLAIEGGKEKAVRLLIDRSADLNSGTIETGLTTSPLIDAAYRNDLNLMRLLISGKANLDQQGKQDMTALHMAGTGMPRRFWSKLGLTRPSWQRGRLLGNSRSRTACWTWQHCLAMWARTARRAARAPSTR